MSDESSTPADGEAIEGKVDNGQSALIRLGDAIVRAGIRDRGDTVEIAYHGDAPRRLPVPVSIGKRALVAIERVPNAAKGFVVLTAVDADSVAA